MSWSTLNRRPTLLFCNYITYWFWSLRHLYMQYLVVLHFSNAPIKSLFMNTFVFVYLVCVFKVVVNLWVWRLKKTFICKNNFWFPIFLYMVKNLTKEKCPPCFSYGLLLFFQVFSSIVFAKFFFDLIIFEGKKHPPLSKKTYTMTNPKKIVSHLTHHKPH